MSDAVPQEEAAPASLRVLIIDDDTKRAKLVEEGLTPDAVVHTILQTHGRGLLDQIAQMQPDVIIMDCNSPDRDTIESLHQVAQANPKPIVMFVEDDDGGLMQKAIQAGVSAYVVDGLKPKRVRPLIDTAIARFKLVSGLQEELRKTKDDLASRKIIEKAKGLLMAQRGMSEDAAFRSLRDMSQQQGKPLKEIAQSVIAVLELLSEQDKGSSE